MGLEGIGAERRHGGISRLLATPLWRSRRLIWSGSVGMEGEGEV